MIENSRSGVREGGGTYGLGSQSGRSEEVTLIWGLKEGYEPARER